MKDGITKKNLLLNIGLRVIPSFLTKEDLKDEWKRTSNKWQILLTYFDKEYVTDFYMGCGLVNENRKPKKPQKKDILYSMIMNDVSNMSFDDFCDEFGYDNNLIKSLEIYKACEEQTKAYYEMFDMEERETLRELLEDY